MEKLLNALEQKLGPIADKLSNNPYLKAITRGTMCALPLTLVAGLIILIAKPPIPVANGEPTMLAGWYYWGQKQTWIYTINSVYNGVVGLAFLIGAAEALAKELNMNARSNMILSLGAYFLIVANPQTYELADGKKINAITFSKLGTNGIFASIIIVILVALIVQFFQKYKIGFRFPDSVPSFVKTSFDGILPAVTIAVIMIALDTLCQKALGSSLSGVIAAVFSPLVKSFDNPFMVAFFMMLINFFWYMGIHGSIVSPITGPIVLSYATENMQAYAEGQQIQHWFTNSTKFGLILVGGAGVLALAVLNSRSKSKTLREVGKVGLIPSIFNISEPTIFGMPVMFNVDLFVPFMLVPIVNTFIVWFVTDVLHLMTGPIVNAPYQAPFILLAVLAYGTWIAGVLAVVLLVIDLVIYYPFYRRYEKKMIAQENEANE